MKIKRGTNANRNNVGIHLFDPTKGQIESAKDDAMRQNFPCVYVHRTKKVVVRKR